VAQGILAAAGEAVLEVRKAPMELPTGVETYEVENPTSEDNTEHTPGKAWDVIGGVYASGAGVVNGVHLVPPGCMIVTRPQHRDLDVPLVRVRDKGSALAAGAFTFAGLPVAGETVSVFGVAFTWRATLTGASNEIILGADAAACCENMRRAVNGGPGRGELYSTTTTIQRDSTTGYAIDDGSATVVAIRAHAAGTAGNALAIAEASTNVTVSGATLAGGADGALGSATTDFIEIALSYVVLQPK
jgi:hypothetical protein